MNRRYSKTGSKDNFNKSLNVWMSQHAQAVLSSLGQIQRNLAGNLFSIAVIGISLALPAGFYLVLDNTQRAMEHWDGNIQMALYLKPEITNARADDLRQELADHPLIEQISLITKEQALEEYKQFSGFGDALDALEENPLPSMLLLQPKLEAISVEQGETLLTELGKLTEVESAQFDRQWVNRLIVILHMLKRAVLILSTLLSVAVLLIIGNTIRLSIISKRSEIAINKLFGATNAYIQRPFLYSGLIFGVAGSGLAWILLIISTLIMEYPVTQLAILYNSDFRLHGLNFKELLVLVGIGGSLGLLGSWIAIGRNIRETDPV